MGSMMTNVSVTPFPVPPGIQVLKTNAFCPTGKGGGVDPTCSPGKGSGGLPEGINPTVPSISSFVRKSLKEGKVLIPKSESTSRVSSTGSSYADHLVKVKKGTKVRVLPTKTGFRVGVDGLGLGGAKGAASVLRSSGFNVDEPSDAAASLTFEITTNSTPYPIPPGIQELKTNAFCPTGKGGGVDPTCSPGEFPSVEAAHKEAKKDWKAWAKQLKPHHFQALDDYQSGAYQGDLGGEVGVFDKLRKGEKLDIGETNMILRLGYAVRGAETKRDVMVFRGLGYKETNYKVGDVVEDKAFMSTSMVRSHVEGVYADTEIYGSPTILELKLPKGTPAAYLDAMGKGKSMGEAEVLLPQYTKYKVISVGKDEKGRIVVRGEVVEAWRETTTNSSPFPVPPGIQVLKTNAFCPTGKGGGVDPTCSPKQSLHKLNVTYGGSENSAGAVLFNEVISQIHADFPDLAAKLSESISIRLESRIRDMKGPAFYENGIMAYHPNLITDIKKRGKDEFDLGGSRVNKSSAGIVRHEVGHHVQRVLGLEKDRKWRSLFDQASSISAYAKVDPFEMFAESFAAYTHPTYRTGDLPPKVESYFAEALGKRLTSNSSPTITSLTATDSNGNEFSLPKSAITNELVQSLTTNATVRPNPLLMDPTGTGKERKALERAILSRLKLLKQVIVETIVTEDAFGLKDRPSVYTSNVFCPTGKGGGVDPTCSPGKSGGGSKGPLKRRDGYTYLPPMEMEEVLPGVTASWNNVHSKQKTLVTETLSKLMEEHPIDGSIMIKETSGAGEAVARAAKGRLRQVTEEEALQLHAAGQQVMDFAVGGKGSKKARYFHNDPTGYTISLTIDGPRGGKGYYGSAPNKFGEYSGSGLSGLQHKSDPSITARMVVIHEYGHLLTYKAGYGSQEIQRMPANKDIARRIGSRYAQKNWAETVAEAYLYKKMGGEDKVVTQFLNDAFRGSTVISNEKYPEEKGLVDGPDLVEEYLNKGIKKLIINLDQLTTNAGIQVLKTNAFCPTGKGGGVDPTCSPGKGESNLSITSLRKDRLLVEMFEGLESLGSVEVLTDLKPVATLENLEIWEEHRGKGNAKKLYKSLFKQLAESFTEVWSSENLDSGGEGVWRSLQTEGLPVVYDSGVYKIDLKNQLTTNAGIWEFVTDDQKVDEFIKWIRSQMSVAVLGTMTTLGTTDPDHWLMKHISDVYTKGMGKVFEFIRKPIFAEKMPHYEGTKAEFLKSAFTRPVSPNRVKLLAGRAYSELSGMTDKMATQMQRSLTDGFIRGESPRDIARQLVKDVDGLGRKQANMIASTEVTRAYNEGQLDSMEELGVEDVGVSVEWRVSKQGTTVLGNPSPCPVCAPLNGIVLKISEARGLLPRHPHCRCAWVASGVGESTKGQKRSQQRIVQAVKSSLLAERPKRKKTAAKPSRWAGSKAKIGKNRPKSILD